MAAEVYEGRDPRDARDALDSRFARFGLRPLSDADVWALGMATMVMPDGSPGPEGYLSQVSGTSLFAERLTIWGRVVAIGIAQAGYKARNGARRRAYVESYDESWGRYAVADGLTLALYGKAADALGYAAQNRQGYIRIRDFVGGALLNAIEEFRVALEWATGSRRDRVFDGRWEFCTGLNYRDELEQAKIGRQDGHGKYPMFAPGCGMTPKADEAYNPGADSSPETLYHGLRPCDWWDEAEARRMRSAPVTTIYPGHGI
jgi:hypothetical protein